MEGFGEETSLFSNSFCFYEEYSLEMDSFQKIFNELFDDSIFKATSHKIYTNDSFELTLHHCKLINNNNNECKGIILLQHPLWFSSLHFILKGKESIVYKLLINGYDVWLGNNRGNEFTKQYNNNKIYNWSFQDMGYLDLTQIIKYINNNACNNQNNNGIIYIGISQGSMQFISLMSTYIEYQKYIKHSIWITPPISFELNNILLYYIIKVLALLPNWFIVFFTRIGAIFGRILPFSIAWICTKLCATLMGFLRLYDSMKYNEVSRLRLKYLPSGFITKTMLAHFRELSIKESIIFDRNNNKIFNISNIKIPISIIIGEHDCCCNVVKTIGYAHNKLKSYLKNLIIIPKMSHLDVIWSDVLPNMVVNLCQKI